MNWRIWDEVEALLVRQGIRPILSIVPSNEDSSLNFGPSAADFWERARTWDRRGWTIGLHGFQHRYVTRSKGLVGLNDFSEFSGLPHSEQQQKLVAAASLMRSNGVTPQLFVAPGHSFDEVTLANLRLSIGVDTVSDGYHRWPYRDDFGMLWIPQQLWSLRWVPSGVWTVCLHPNLWTSADLERFARAIPSRVGEISDVPTIVAQFGDRRAGPVDHVYARAHGLGIRIRRRLRGGASTEAS